MVNDTTLLLDLDGVSVVRVERLGDGSRRVHMVTADEAARACPACGVFASRVKGTAVTRPRDLPYGESRLQFLWHKRRWYCHEAGCSRRSFTEQIPQIPAGARLTTRLRGAAGRRIRDADSTVIEQDRRGSYDFGRVGLFAVSLCGARGRVFGLSCRMCGSFCGGLAAGEGGAVTGEGEHDEGD
ncbi:transposase family protein, partial [Streptomyces sp. NPDC056821]|uniref:transposase family protein n=1 Tax=unclassified Streptomyces TaxID=2593676 RepID=UPI0036A799EC